MGPADIQTISSTPNHQEGWGPILGTPKPLFSDYPTNLPYAPFNRSDKLGRIADFTRNPNNNNNNNNDSNNPFTEIHSKPKPIHQTKFHRFQKKPQLPQRKDAEPPQPKKLFSNNHQPSRREYKSSVDIHPEWNVIEQLPFSNFTKLAFTIPEPQDLLTCGELGFYDKSYDKITPNIENRLQRFKNRSFFKVTTSDDPVIRRLANEDEANVFATDEILSTLMCANRSVYSWDIVVHRVGNKLFFDKRGGSGVDLVSVNETAQEALPDGKEDINSAHSLSVEAAYINQNFSQQVLMKDGGKLSFDERNPFAGDNEEAASAAYRYRRWKLADGVSLVARCEVHGVMEVQGKQAFMTLNALNEFDPKYTGIEWRKKLETQRGAVLATELKNNANKLARWTAQALLASADVMKLGFVSRVHPRDHFNHAVLAVVGYKPKEFATQINLNTSNMWGIVKSIVELCMKLKEGKYVLVKDPAKPQVRIYEVPADAFENEYVEEPLPEAEQVKPRTEEEENAENGVVLSDNA